MFIFTDGNCIRNGKVNPIGAYGVYIPDYPDLSEYKFVKNPTNNICELHAIKRALEIIRDNKLTNCLIYTDSMYSINCITKWIKTWERNGYKTRNNKPIKNKQLIIDINNCLRDTTLHVSFLHVNSHTKPPQDLYSREYKIWHGNYIVDSEINNLIKSKTQSSCS